MPKICGTLKYTICYPSKPSVSSTLELEGDAVSVFPEEWDSFSKEAKRMCFKEAVLSVLTSAIDDMDRDIDLVVSDYERKLRCVQSKFTNNGWFDIVVSPPPKDGTMLLLCQAFDHSGTFHDPVVIKEAFTQLASWLVVQERGRWVAASGNHDLDFVPTHWKYIDVPYLKLRRV